VKHFNIEVPYHTDYLDIQAGDIAYLLPAREAWLEEYDRRIERVYQSMLPVLPQTCGSLLDIGGGLSGIGARLCEHYGGETHVAVLDGKNTLAYVDKHAQPFNNATRTQNFLRLNGVRHQSFYEPQDELRQQFDLIISTQAWPFHIGVNVYLPRVVKALVPGGTLIVDVRKSHPEWRLQLEQSFGPAQTLAAASKWERLAFRSKHAE